MEENEIAGIGTFLIFLCLIGIFSYIFFFNHGVYSADEQVIEEDVVEDVQPVKSYLDLQVDKAPVLEFVSSTEYTRGDGDGATIIKLTDWRGDKINTSCWESILYPNKTIYVGWSPMTQHWEYGNYYFNFAIPETIGVYDQEVKCVVSNKNLSIGKGFHVSNITGMVENIVETNRPDVMSIV